MALEIPGYRENLADLLEFFNGRRILSVSDVCRYTGHDRRWVQTRLGIQPKKGVSVPTLARRLAEL